MDNALFVSAFERLSDLGKHRKRFLDGDSAGGDAIGQCPALDQLHDKEPNAVGFLQVVNRSNV